MSKVYIIYRYVYILRITLRICLLMDRSILEKDEKWKKKKEKKKEIKFRKSSHPSLILVVSKPSKQQIWSCPYQKHPENQHQINTLLF